MSDSTANPAIWAALAAEDSMECDIWCNVVGGRHRQLYCAVDCFRWAWFYWQCWNIIWNGKVLCLKVFNKNNHQFRLKVIVFRLHCRETFAWQSVITWPKNLECYNRSQYHDLKLFRNLTLKFSINLIASFEDNFLKLPFIVQKSRSSLTFNFFKPWFDFLLTFWVTLLKHRSVI